MKQWNWRKKNKQLTKCFTMFGFLSSCKKTLFFIKQTWILHKCLMMLRMETGPLVIETTCVCKCSGVFWLFCFYLTMVKTMSFISTMLNSPYPRMICIFHVKDCLNILCFKYTALTLSISKVFSLWIGT